jgi:hypothetical protein
MVKTALVQLKCIIEQTLANIIPQNINELLVASQATTEPKKS